MKTVDIAALLGHAKPATTSLLAALAQSSANVREHEHPKHEDIYCHNLLWYMGERMPTVLRRLVDAEARAAELERAAVEGRAALASLCHDHKDPGTAALGALFLLQQATAGTPTQPGETALTIYRAEHPDAGITLGTYASRPTARKHCETVLRREVGEEVFLGWVPDVGSELAAEELCISEDFVCSGYLVTPVEVASEYDEEADE